MKKSRFLAILLAVMITLSSFSCLSVISFAAIIDYENAVDDEGNYLGKIWELEDTGILTIYMDYEGVPWDQHASKIKEVVVKTGVTTINNSSFAGYANLEKVTFEGVLATIGAGAFQNCDKLTAVTLRSTTEIKNYAFYDCDALEAVSIGGGLATGLVGKNIFKSCDSLKSLTILNGAQEIGEGMFEDCIALGTISLPDSIEVIGRLAFENCGALKNIIIPDSTIEVGEYAFYDCSSVETAYIGHNVEKVGEYAFGNCTALESAEIKCAMPAISDGMFYGCSSLKGLTNLPEGIKTIGKNAFKDCVAFAEIVIPSTVTIIGDSAFDSTAITKIDIPVSVESIGEGAFTNCAALTAINVAAKNRFYASVDGVLYDAALKSVICCPAGKTGTVTITAGAETIGSDAFIGCTGVTVIEIPDSVKSIASNAFNGCADDLKIKADCDSYATEYAKLYAIDLEKTHSDVSDWIVTVDPTCDNAGTKEKQCSACGYVIETGIVDAIGHNYDDGVVTTKPTCEADGVVTYTCQNNGCDSKYTVGIPATGHNYDNGTVTLEPTCENDGKKVFRCQNDGCYSYYEITLPATGHNMDNGTVKTEATCEADGEKIYKCKDETCGYVVKETIPALGHKYNAGDITLAPLCEVNGVKTYTCTRTDCGSVYTETIPATGHKYDKGVITKYPTVKAEGEITFTCENEWCTADNCANHTYKVAIPNTAFSGLKATNDGAYADENGDFHNLTWYITNTDDLVILADDTAEEWAPYRNTVKTVTITGEATTVENGSFAYMKALTDARILLSLGTIEAYAFQYCENLKNVETGSISEIQNFAFYSCKSLVSVDIYGGLEEGKVGRNIFLDCEKLSNVILRNGCLEIGEAMFKGCAALEEIVLPESIVVIGDSAFDGTSLKEIRIPTDVKEIQKGVFTNCAQLEAINVDSKNDFYFSVDGVLYDVSLDSLIICPAGKKGEVTVWDGTEKIADDAFIGCKNVTKVNIPDSVTAIADNAFNGCSDDLVIAANCNSTAIAYAIARGITTDITHVAGDMWKVTVEPTCLEKGSKERVCTACDYSYEKVEIDALGHNYDNGVVTTKATCENDGVKTFTCTREGCEESYTEVIPAIGHKYDKGVVTLAPTCEADGEKLFTCTNDCGSSYTEAIPAIGHKYDKGVVTLAPTCEADGEKTFTCANCGDSYTEAIPAIGHKYDKGIVTKEATCEENGVKTFTCTNAGCDDEYTEAIPAIGHDYDEGVITKAPTLNEDGEKLFTCQNVGCGHTYTEAIPNVAFVDILAINDGAYADKDGKIQNVTWYLTKSGALYVYADGTEAEWADYKASIKSAVIAKTVKTIAKNAFANCTALESVALAEGVEVLGKNAFKGCKALTSIELPETLNKIGDSAFDGTSIKEIYIPADVDVIEKGAFTNCLALENIEVDTKNDNYFSFDGALYDMSLGSLLLCPAGKKGELTVWSSTTKIAEDAFVGCENITKVIISSSITEIADNAFNGCSDELVIACDCDSYAAAFANGRGIATEITHTGIQIWQVITEATCIEDGSRALVCSNCEYSYKTEIIVALGHKYDKGVVTEEPTCETEGEKLFTCQNGCGDTYTEVIPATGHKYDKGVVTLEPTCEADGVKTFTCTNTGCDDEYTEAIPAIGHKYDKGIVTKEATCEEDGVKTFTCTNAGCDDEYTEAIPAIGHDYDEGVITKAPTLNGDGEKLFTCQNVGCGHTYTEAIPNVAFVDILAINDGAYADKDGKIQNVTWYLTKSGTLYIYADDTESEWEDYKVSIKSAVIAKTVKTIAKNAFANCTALESVALAEGVEVLGKNAFKGCKALTSIELPETLNKIGDSAFDGTSIKEIYIPADVDVIEKGAFTNCAKLEAINVDSKNDNYFSKDGVLYDVSLGSLIICPAGKSGEVTVWNGTEKIADDAFIGCKNVTKVNIPDSVTTIADNAFNGCSDELIIACNCDSAAAAYAKLRGIDSDITHVLGDMWKVTVEPTCLEKGSKERVCTACDYSYEKVEIDALGHNYDNGVVTTKETCENDGVKTFTCTREGCEESYTEVIPATGHKYDKGVVTKEATCEEDGVKTFTCTNAGCDDEYTEAISAIGHKYDKGVVTKEATCDADGVKTFTCTNAGCDSEYTEAIPAIGHKYDKGVVTKKASCEEDGVKTFTCTNAGCGSEYTEAIPAIGHKYDKGVITKQPTLKNNGVKLFTCQNAGCGHTYTKSIPNVAFTDILAINDGAYADENNEICNITWYLTKSGTLYVYADGTEAEWADYKAAIKSAVIAKTVKTIAKNAFAKCTALESVALAEGVEVLGKNAFKGCKALTSIELPETLNKIGDSAFDGTSIKEIYIPADVDVIEKGAFTNCAKLTTISVDDKNDNYFSVSGVLYDVSLGSLIICPAGKSGTVKVKRGTLSIADDAFIGCKNVTKVNIPDSVTTIADNAFNGCSDDLIIACNCDSAAAEYAVTRDINTSFTHTAGDVWKVTVEPTCLEKGSKERVCSGCEYSYEKVAIAALGHEYTSSVTKKATCEKDGVLTYKCTRTGCGDTYTEVIPATGHKYDKGVVTKEATCEEAGVKTFTCQNADCDSEYTEAIPAIGHKYDKGVVTKEATCEEDGVKTFTCTNTGCDSEYTKAIPAIGHKYDKGVVTKEATCEKAGVKTFTCTNAGCDDKYTEAIPALTHKYIKTVVKEGTCITRGLVEYKCKKCGDSYTKKPYGEHQLYSYPVRTEPTCDKAGKEGDLCALCHKYVGEVKVIPATNHEEYKWVVDTKATCTTAGSKHKECTECGEILAKKKIAALGHSEGDWKTVKKATVYAAGKKTKSCTECGKTLKTASIAQLKCSKPNLKTAKNTASGIKITWGATKGADYYRVYRKVKGGEWKYLDSTSKTYFTDKTAKSGTKYYYAVRARNEAGNSVLSSSISKCFLNDPTLNSATSTKSGVVLKWSKVTGAEGYIVYRKAGSGSYKKIKLENGVSNTSYTDKSAKKGVKYTYKVKAVYSKTTSVYSNAKSVTDKY